MYYERAEFYEYVDSIGKRYLKYKCAKCKKYHVVRTSNKQSSRIRNALNMVNKRIDDSVLILWCGKGKLSIEDYEGLSIVIRPMNKIPKAERDLIDKRIKRIQSFIKARKFELDEKLFSAEKIIDDGIEKLTRKIEDAKQSILSLEGMKEDFITMRDSK